MLNFVGNVFLWTFALYGLFEIIKLIIHTYYKPKISSNGIFLFIAVKNQESVIEGFLRSILFRLIYGKEEFFDKIIVIDLNSTDRTLDILNMIASDYECVQVLTLDSTEELLTSLSNNT